MPVNNELPTTERPVEFKTGQLPNPKILDQLWHIGVTLIDAPSREALMHYITPFTRATWEDLPRNDYTEEQREESLSALLQGRVLPTALETVGLTFRVDNIDLIDVTHLLRHRTFSFSAHCTADRDMRHDAVLAKSCFQVDPQLFRKYVQVVGAAYQLYAELVDRGDVSILDARTILPRCTANYYYFRANLKDVIHFLRQRFDRQIQPESDNIVAMRMWIEMCRWMPQLKPLIDLDAPDSWYIKTAPTEHSSNIYMPEIPRNDTFEYNEQWFLYKKQRSEMLGGERFVGLWKKLRKELEEI